MEKINPLFSKKKVQVLSSASPIDNSEMQKLKIYSTDGREIPVEVDIRNRVCLPVEE